MDQLQKGLWYSPVVLPNRLSENVQDIQQGHKIHYESHEKPVSGINCRRKIFTWSESQKRHNPGSCTFALTIWNRNDTIQLYTKEVHYKFTKS